MLLKNLQVQLKARQYIFAGEFINKAFYNCNATIVAVNNTCLLSGSISQANLAPFSTHLSILFFKPFKVCEGLFNSIIKSGQTGANFIFCSSVSTLIFLQLTQAASGEKTAPSGSVNPVLDSNTFPVFNFLFQRYNLRLQ